MKFLANCYQDLDGRYLSIEEHRRSQTVIEADDKEEAFIILSERQHRDSELTIEERWSVHEL